MKFLNISSVHNFLRSFLFCILMVYGTTAAHAVDYIYNIINNSGQLVMRVKGGDNSSNTKLYLPNLARTPFAKDYRYYKTLVEAQNDARYGKDEAVDDHHAVAYAENTNITPAFPSSGTVNIYVRYGYNPSASVTDSEGNMVRIDGSVAYNLQVENRLVYYSTDTDSYTEPNKKITVTPKADEPIRVTPTKANQVTATLNAHGGEKAYQWFFIGTKAGAEGVFGHPDPYDIKIQNVSLSGRVLTAIQTNSIPFTSVEDQPYLHLAYQPDNTSSSTNVQRFFFRYVTNQFQIAAAKPLYVYRNGGNTTKWFVLNKETSESQYSGLEQACYPSLHMRLHNKHESVADTRAKCQFYRVKVHKYVIVGDDGTKRARAFASIDESETLQVPKAIRSAVPVTYSYYTSLANANKQNNAITTLPDVNTTPTIYVRYNYSPGQNPMMKLDGTAKYTVAINDRYVKYDATCSEDSHVKEGDTEEAENAQADYIWRTWGNDPYGIYVTNETAGSTTYFTGTGTTSIEMGTTGHSAAIQATSSLDHMPSRYFLVLSSQYQSDRPKFLFRAVNSDDEGDDHFSWGYYGDEDGDWDEVRPRFMNSSHVGDENDAVQMQIYEMRNDEVTYHIIDKHGKEVISAKNKKVLLAVPEEIYSPLVSTYHYYPSTAFTVDNGVYTLTDASQEMTGRVTTGLTDIYVTYDVGTEVDLTPVENETEAGIDHGKHKASEKKKYMIRFLNGQNYYQEDGKDGLTDGVHTTRKAGGSNDALGVLNKQYKAEYAYINGDGNFNVYCDSVRNKQFTNAANERTRWSWYLEADNRTGQLDPYHVTIVAASNVAQQYKDSNDKVYDNYYSYFYTYYNSTLGSVVTSTISKDPKVTTRNAADVPTEYMILGSKGKYRLVTSAPINDGTTTAHRTVNSLEQYWKNYDLIKGNYFFEKNDDVLTQAQIDELKARGWHRYEAWAYARPGWEKSKKYEYKNHWYQTFDVGAEFDLVEVQTEPAIILLDKRGWEVFRHPMPNTSTNETQTALSKVRTIFIGSYDSPMVTYHWYKSAQKQTGRPQYAPYDPAMTADGQAEYTSESLIDFPPNYGDNDGNWYVTYDVKDEYKYLYLYANGEGKSAPVMIQQNSKWATAASATNIGGSSEVNISGGNENLNIEGDVTNDMLWYLAPNATIDTEMGWTGEAQTYTDDQMCFDPYNVQVKNVNNGKYFKTAAADATLTNYQHWLATLPYNMGLGDNAVVTSVHSTENHDHLLPKITNTTFMVIKDKHGNLRFCMRFDHESAVTNLTSDSPVVNGWVYDVDENNNVIETKADSVAMQAIKLYPIQKYQIHVRDINSNGPDVQTTGEFYAVAGTSLMHTLGVRTAPLPTYLIRAYCDYPGAYTSYDQTTNTYSGKVTNYPPGEAVSGSGSAISTVTHIYVPYQVIENITFFNSEEEALASNNWSFLMQGLESVAVIQGKKLIDYGKEERYGYRTADWSEDIGEDIEGLTPAELSFVSNSQTKIVNRNKPGTVEMGTKVGGFHFLRRIGTVNVNTETGKMTVPQSTTDDVRTLSGDRYYPSQKRTYKVHMLSLLNDFRRIAETYKDGKETGFREGSWLWAFIGNPYKFYVINKEAGPKKRLAVEGGNEQGAGAVLKLIVDTLGSSKCYFTISKQAVQTDEEEYRTFVMQVWDGDDNGDNDMMVQWRYDNNGQFFTEKKNVGNKDNKTPGNPDIAKMKTASFMAFPWEWDDKKYQKVTVNIYPGTEANHGALALTKTYERSDRAFVAGDVIDGTDGHFYLPLDAQEDGSWKPFGVYTNTIPYDGHKINIPHELRRRYCKYTVENGGYTVQQDDSDNPTAQVINVYYTVDTENAPLFIAESELADFRQYIKAGKDATYKDGKKYSDYFYFLDQNWQLAKHLYVQTDNKGDKGYSEPTRFSATNDPKQLMWYFVGDPYNVRLFNVYTDIKNSNETRNFVRHRYADQHQSSGYGTGQTDDDRTFMEDVSKKVFYWEMVDTWVGDPKTKGELDSTHVNVSFRKELLYGKPFALRMKVTGSANPEAVISDATYFYLKDNGSTVGNRIYNYQNNTLQPRQNELDAFANFPDSRHKANSTSTTLTPLKPTKVKVTVFDPDEPTRKVTEDEVSDYFAITDHFKGVPDNLQRKHCEYWWVSTDPDPKSTNMVDENLYFTVSEENPHIYARYREDAESPFSTLVDGKPVLKRDASLSPWYNMNIGGWWAFFNSSLDGKTYAINGTGANRFNNSELSFPYKGNTLPNTTDKFRKGLQWALIGDPYNFTLRNNRDLIVSGTAVESGQDDERASSYLYDTGIASTGTTWTWLHNGVNTDEYFLSESRGRRTEVVAATNGAKTMNGPRRILPSPSDYTISAQTETRNFKVVDGTGASNGMGVQSINTGDNYGVGSNMWLLSVNDSSANNESFDAIVNVYNKLNELVATTGWTELARKNAEWNGSLPVDVRRWGCTYHYWADETMTRYPFHSYDQTDDGQPKGNSNNYLVKDGSTIYVTYDYDESLYSSENEYRWVNIFFNWDDDHKEWTEDDVPDQYNYTEEYWEYNKGLSEFEFRHSYKKKKTHHRWVQHDLYTDTQEGWIESPKTSADSFNKDKAYAYYGDGQYADSEVAKNQKWAMIGDPYKFILYNYNRKAEAGTNNAYYLWCNTSVMGQYAIGNNNFDKFPGGKDKYKGLYWTWKVDGTRFTFAEGDAEHNKTTYGPRAGLPESFYQDYQTASTTSNDSIKKAGYSIETGYLANCAMQCQSLYDKENLVGTVNGFVTYKHKSLRTVKDETAEPLEYTTGTTDKFHVYNEDDKYADDRTIDYTSDTTTVIDAVYDGGELKSDAVLFKDKWTQIYGTNSGHSFEDGKFTSGPYTGYYIGPIESIKKDLLQTFTTYKYIHDYTISGEISDTEQSLVLEVGTSIDKLKADYAAGKKTTQHIPRFLVMPMAAQAKSITFHLQTDTYSDGRATQSLRSANDIVFDHTSKNYGVGNTLTLPWMMRRQYCDYKFYLKETGDNILDARKNDGLIDDLTYTENALSNAHRLSNRSGSAYTGYWTSTTDLSENTDCYNSLQNEYVVPQDWADKDVFILVKYKPSAEFEAMKSTGADAAKWVNIMNVENGNMMRYTRSGNVTGASRDSLNDVTNDYLWAIEGDPYGFKLHNRYADHGFDGTTQNEKWSTLLTTDKVNTTEKFNYLDGVYDGGTPKNENFTYNANGDPVKKSGITYGKAGSGSGFADAFGTMSETDENTIFEAMTGNYDEGMIIHPVNACINVRNQNGYKYYGAYLFNGAPTGDPVQLNYMQDWEVMRNVYANWQFVKPAAKQFLPYYNRAGFVGGLKTDVADAANNKAIFDKIAVGTTLNDTEYNTVWSLVQDPDNLVPFESGKLYRLKAYSAGNGVVGGDYVSGYLHKTELDGEKPLHIYGKAGDASNISSLLSYEGNEWAADVANKSLLEIPDVEFDPSSIFRVTRDDDGYVKMETQGLVVSDSKMMAEPNEPTTEQANSMLFEMQDIGLGAFQMRTKASATAATPVETAYLSCNPNTLKYGLNTEAKELNIASGISSGATVKTHDTKWLLEPVGTTADNASGNVYQHALRLKLTSFNDDVWSTTFSVPYDIKLPEGVEAYYCGGSPQGVPGGNAYHGTLELTQIAAGETIPAGTPVIVKTTTQYVDAANGNSIVVTVPYQASSAKVGNEFFVPKYLTGEVDHTFVNNERVFVYGKVKGNPTFAVNATRDYDGQKNNRFTSHNKLYIILNNDAVKDAQAKGFTLVFGGTTIEGDLTGIDEVENDNSDNRRTVDDDTIYDIQGRKVERITQPGIYIRNGKKFVVRRGQY